MQATSLNKEPSKTALGTAFMRAILAKEVDPALTCDDNLAHIFLSQDFLTAVNNTALRNRIRNKANKGAYEFMLARTKLIDNLFKAHLSNKTPQIVLLGAGFDTRAWRFQDLNKHTLIYEMDLPVTQQYKLKCLLDSEIESNDRVHFVPTSFNLQTLSSDLLKAGFDPEKRTFFIWEGVTHYLTNDIVDKTLDFMKTHSAPNSEVIFDYIYRSVIDGDTNNEDTRKLISWAEQSGEPFKFGISDGDIEQFLTDRGLALINSYSPDDLENEFLRDSNGDLIGKTTGFYCFAYARI